MGFFKTLFTGYRLMYQDLTTKHNDLIPRCFSGCGTGLMMIGSAVMAKTSLKDDVQQVHALAVVSSGSLRLRLLRHGKS